MNNDSFILTAVLFHFLICMHSSEWSGMTVVEMAGQDGHSAVQSLLMSVAARLV